MNPNCPILPVPPAGLIGGGRLLFLRKKNPKNVFVKSPYALLRGILRRCSVQVSTPHSSDLARFASGAFYKPIWIFILFVLGLRKFNAVKFILDRNH
jgi:hypothetical protein